MSYWAWVKHWSMAIRSEALSRRCCTAIFFPRHSALKMALRMGTSGLAICRALWIMGCTTLNAARPRGVETTLSMALERKFIAAFSPNHASFIPDRHLGVPGRASESDAEAEVYVLLVTGVGVEIVGGATVELVALPKFAS